MEIREKVFEALRQELPLEYMHLDDDDGIIGYIVSNRFIDMPTLDRHKLLQGIYKARLSREEVRRILTIAPFTADEWGAIGQPILIQSVTQSNPKTVSVVVEGSPRDAEFVRELLDDGRGVTTSEACAVPGKEGSLLTFTITSAAGSTLTRKKVLGLLRSLRALDVAPALG